jgi:N utilization substance protein B
MKRVSYIDRAILRFSTYSLFFQDDVPDTVVINEAVDLAKIFGTDDSYRFVNGVLDGIRKHKEKDEQ